MPDLSICTACEQPYRYDGRLHCTLDDQPRKPMAMQVTIDDRDHQAEQRARSYELAKQRHHLRYA